MRKLTLYTAATLDGYIAGPNGELDWLDITATDPQQPDYGYNAFMDSIDTTIQGTTTYQLAAHFNKDPYPGKTNYVFTRATPPPPDSGVWRFITGDIATFVRTLKQEDGAGIWLVGGGQINTVMLNAGLIDEIVVTLFPVVLGNGIPLFAPGADRSEFHTLSSESYETGLVQWTMLKG
ncbi:MAG: dihydrofolate reductase family protein [Chloroflexi bacterium]|nr:dihydrofolate reductase family protein [Chloroflexota bacterium]